ncbi:hypothetical protein BGZ94_008969 [Podila epigama]|nr:hypothetical protein BGZ94_008969 [Podila epigama]
MSREEVTFESTSTQNYVEDVDLQTLTVTCKRLRSLAMDGPLRRHILLKRTPARLNSFLSSRPSRDILATKNILRGMHIQQHIRQGQYIGGETAVRSYHVLCRLERQMVSIKIARKLRTRPEWHELVERGLMPEEMFVNQEEYDTRCAWKNYQQQQMQYKTQAILVNDNGNDIQGAAMPVSMSLSHKDGHEGWNQPAIDGNKSDRRCNSHPFDISNETQSLTNDDDSSMTVTNLHSQPHHKGEGSTTLSSQQQQQQQHQHQEQEIENEVDHSETPSRLPLKRQRKSISMDLVPKIGRLRKAMDRDRLSRFVQTRPSPTELNQAPGTATVLHAYHLIAFGSTSPDLVPMTTQLSFLLKGERLRHWLYRRPSLSVILNERHILKTEVRTAWMVCPGVNKKVRFYENLIQEKRHYDQQLQERLRHSPRCQLHYPSDLHLLQQQTMSPTIEAS